MTQRLLKEARSYLGVKQGDVRHKELVKKYNAVKPLPVGYSLKETDDWCAAFVTVMADRTAHSKLIGRECGVHRFVQLFKKNNIWLGVVKPKVGDLIVFDWHKNSWMDHIGIVEKFSENKVTVIEGNSSRMVARRVYNWNDWRIAGYARPNYPKKTASELKPMDTIAKEVIQGKWGNGSERQTKLKKAGYDAKAIQKLVNQLLSTKSPLKSDKTIAREVLKGKWGNGNERRNRLEKAGYDARKIQKKVNELMADKKYE